MSEKVIFDTDPGQDDAVALHDPCVTAFVLKPEIFTGRAVNVEIETGSALTRGMSVVDYWGVTGRPKNAFWVRSGNADAYFALLAERVGRLR